MSVIALADRFKSHTKLVESGCYEWTGWVTQNGYGQIKVNKKSLSAHRVAWELVFGAIPTGKCVLHLCDNRICCNPEHLFLGTHSENMQDMVAKGRNDSTGSLFNLQKTHCPQGHPYNEINTYIKPNGHRICRTCRKTQLSLWKQTRRKFKNLSADAPTFDGAGERRARSGEIRARLSSSITGGSDK